MLAGTYHLAEGKTKDTAKCTSQHGTSEKDGNALVDLLTAVPCLSAMHYAVYI